MRPPLVLCSGSLGPARLDEKFRAAAEAGFDGVSVYGHEVTTAAEAGFDGGGLARDLGLMIAEVDGVAISSQHHDRTQEAVEIAHGLGARSITMVEAGEYDPSDERQFARAVEVFAALCDHAAEADVLVHIEPFSWSSLGRIADAMAIVDRADRPNGGLLLDIWHHVRGPDDGELAAPVDPARIFGIQLADTLPEPWPHVRDECMTNRLLPGRGTAQLAERVRWWAARGPLPPIGVEVFNDALHRRPLDQIARDAYAGADAVLTDAGL